MTLSDELLKLHQLHQAGVITEAEFVAAKANLLNQTQFPPGATGNPQPPVNWDPQVAEAATKEWALLLHLSQFLSAVVPFAGLVVPVVIWQIKKTDLPGIDVHGKIVVNWILSMVIYAVVSVLLAFVLIGIPLLIGLALAAIVFPIIGAVKANNGEAWPYPLSIKFFT